MTHYLICRRVCRPVQNNQVQYILDRFHPTKISVHFGPISSYKNFIACLYNSTNVATKPIRFSHLSYFYSKKIIKARRKNNDENENENNNDDNNDGKIVGNRKTIGTTR
jgi:hypothetical protein